MSLSVERNPTVVILGPSGAGKTTILKVIITAMPPDSGEVLIDRGRIVAEGTPDEVRANGDPLVRQFMAGSAAGAGRPLEPRRPPSVRRGDRLNL